MEVLKEYISYEESIKGSRFLSELFPCDSQAAARELVKSQKAKYADATHVVHAFVIGPGAEVMGMSDDGEPSGTAGMPMLGVLRKQELQQVAAVVTRYFGGVKLGAGGLVRAYSGSVAQAVEAAGLAQKVKMGRYVFSSAPAEAGKIINLLYRQQLFALTDTEYGNVVHFTLRMPEDQKSPAEKWLTDQLQQPTELTEAGFEYEEVPI